MNPSPCIVNLHKIIIIKIIFYKLDYAGISLNIHSILLLPIPMPVTSRPLPNLRIDKSRPVSGCLWGEGKGRKSASHDPPDMLAADYGDQHRKQDCKAFSR